MGDPAVKHEHQLYQKEHSDKQHEVNMEQKLRFLISQGRETFKQFMNRRRLKQQYDRKLKKGEKSAKDVLQLIDQYYDTTNQMDSEIQKVLQFLNNERTWLKKATRHERAEEKEIEVDVKNEHNSQETKVLKLDKKFINKLEKESNKIQKDVIDIFQTYHKFTALVMKNLSKDKALLSAGKTEKYLEKHLKNGKKHQDRKEEKLLASAKNKYNKIFQEVKQETGQVKAGESKEKVIANDKHEGAIETIHWFMVNAGINIYNSIGAITVAGFYLGLLYEQLPDDPVPKIFMLLNTVFVGALGGAFGDLISGEIKDMKEPVRATLQEENQTLHSA